MAMDANPWGWSRCWASPTPSAPPPTYGYPHHPLPPYYWYPPPTPPPFHGYPPLGPSPTYRSPPIRGYHGDLGKQQVTVTGVHRVFDEMAPCPAPVVYESVAIQSSFRKGDSVMQSPNTSGCDYGLVQASADQVFDDSTEIQRRVLSVRLQHQTKPVPVEVIRKTFACYGVVERLAYSAETPQLHVLVQFQNRLMAVEAAEALQGEYIEGTICQLEILLARESELQTFQKEDGLKKNSTSVAVPARGEICQTWEHEKQKRDEQEELEYEATQEDHDTEVAYVFQDHDLTVTEVLSSLQAVLNGKMSLCNVNLATWVQQLDKEQEGELFRGISDFPHPRAVNRSDDRAVWNRKATNVISLCKFIGNPWQNLESSGQDETSIHLIAPQQECWLPHQGKRKQKNSIEHYSGKIESFLPYVTIGNELCVPWDPGNRMKTELLMTHAPSNAKNQQPWDPGKEETILCEELKMQQLMLCTALKVKLLLPWNPGNHANGVSKKLCLLQHRDKKVNICLPWDPGKSIEGVNVLLQASSNDARLSIPWDPGDQDNICMKGILNGLISTMDIQFLRMEQKKLIMDATYGWDPGIPQSITRIMIFDFAKFSSPARKRLLFWNGNGFSAVNRQRQVQKYSGEKYLLCWDNV